MVMLVGAIMFHARRPRIHLISHGATRRFTSVASYMDRPVERRTTDMGPQPIPNLALIIQSIPWPDLGSLAGCGTSRQR